jgi:acetylornithine aminotransferase
VALHSFFFTSGAPLQTRVAHHVLTRITEPSFLARVESISAHLRSRLSSLRDKFPSLIPSDVRGRGLMLGLPFAKDEQPGQVIKLCRERGVLLLTCGNKTVRFVPSLIVSEEEVDKVCDVLESVLVLIQKENK